MKAKLDKDVRTIINSKFATLLKKIDEIRNTANEALKVAKWNEQQIIDIKAVNENNSIEWRAKVDQLPAAHEELKANMASNTSNTKTLLKRVEDLTNRSSRKSLVFKGVPERSRETWDDTRNLLADLIAANANINSDDAFEMIERCHRGSFNNQGGSIKKKGPRYIYCGFHSWDDSQFVLERFRRASISGKIKGIYVEQRYGATTTARRNHALYIRKDLKANGTITSGCVSYPVKLMVKYRALDSKFTLHEDFSDMEVGVQADAED